MYVNRWIETHAHIRPNKVALIDRVSGVSFTYLDLHRSSHVQAYRLASLGVQAGDRVAVYSQNRPEILELLLACGLLGACLVPLNWRLTPQELEKIVADCQPKLTFVEPGLPGGEGLQAHSIFELQTVPAEPVALPRVTPETPLAIFYTGGTTGVPKGAVLTHKSMQANAWNTIGGWGLSPEDIAPIFTPMFHTGGLNVVATPLFCLGGTLVLPGNFDPAKSLEIIEQEKCTFVFLVPTMYEMLRQAPGFSRSRVAHVRKWISGGAPCPKTLFEAYWGEGIPLIQGYGLTEAGPNTFGVSFEDAQKRSGTVGVPLPGIEVKLSDSEGKEVPVGTAGELHVRGDHVMSGYWNKPNETAQVLEDGWLATGDLAYRDADGFYYICGRRKEMFISGGENVFPAEIEEVVLTHPNVAEVAVVGVPHPKWGEVGRAYLVLKQPAEHNEAELVEHLQKTLAKYKVPKEYVVMDSLPKSAAGKVLKRMLMENQEAGAAAR
ncbi:AMP-binding protein [bacterium]|nr:AMP-binding protein [bacterium]